MWRTLVCAEVDADDMAGGLAQGMFGRLRSAAAGDQHGQIRAIGSVRPMQVKVRAAPVFILPTLAIPVQVVNRRRIGVQVIESPHGLLDAVCLSAVGFEIVHVTVGGGCQGLVVTTSVVVVSACDESRYYEPWQRLRPDALVDV